MSTVDSAPFARAPSVPTVWRAAQLREALTKNESSAAGAPDAGAPIALRKGVALPWPVALEAWLGLDV